MALLNTLPAANGTTRVLNAVAKFSVYVRVAVRPGDGTGGLHCEKVVAVLTEANKLGLITAATGKLFEFAVNGRTCDGLVVTVAPICTRLPNAMPGIRMLVIRNTRERPVVTGGSTGTP